MALRRSFFIGLLAVPVALAACTTSTSDDVAEPDEATSVDDLTSAGALVGTWQLDEEVDGEGQALAGWLPRLALKKDGTCWFDEEGMVFDQDGMNGQVGHFDAECTYQVRKSADGRYTWLALSYAAPSGAKASAKWFYRRLGGGKVQLSYDVRGREQDRDFFGMHRTDDRAWCKAATDCSLQNLPQPRCPGQWACDQIRPDKVLTYTVPACVYRETCGR